MASDLSVPSSRGTTPTAEIPALRNGQNCPATLETPLVLTNQSIICNSYTHVGLYHSGPRTDYSIQHAYGKLTLTAALSGTNVRNVAYRLKSLPTHDVQSRAECVL